MRQADLNRAVARATGESVRQIARLGFCLLLVLVLATPSRLEKSRSHRTLHRGPLTNPATGPNACQSA